jgi:hypothetical protein
MSPPTKKEKTWVEQQAEIAEQRKQKGIKLKLAAQGPTPDQQEKLRLIREQQVLDQHKAQLASWVHEHQEGEILHEASKALEFVHWTTHEVQAKKAQIVQLQLKFSEEKDRLEKEIIVMEHNQTQRKIHYDMAMDAIHQERKFAPLPKPIPTAPEAPIVKKSSKIKKKKMVEIEVEEEPDDLRHSGTSSPPTG